MITSRQRSRRIWVAPRLRNLLLALALVLATARPVVPWAAEYGDVLFERKAAGMEDVPPAVFPHWVHRLQFKCAACHDAPFKMKAGANLVTMDDIQAGRSCGVCHNGKDAFISNFDTCSRCHRK